MRINNEIRASEVRLITAEGEQLGIVSIREALNIAEKRGMDLVEIAPNATPPVCKLLDFGKYKYQQHKREKESKKKQHIILVKEVRFRPGTEKHDLETKGRKIREFLSDGAKVKITIMFRGREMAHQDYGIQTMNSILEMLDDIAKPDFPPKMEGRFLSTVLTPKT